MSAATNTSANDIPGFEFTPRQTGDVISDDLMAEFSRRLRLASSPVGDSSLLSIGFGGATASDASGNQIIVQGNGLFVPFGAGLSVLPGNGLVLNGANQIAFNRRIFQQLDTIAADGNKIFALPEQMDSYAVFITAISDPSAAGRFWIVNKTSVAVTVGFAGLTANTIVEITAVELPA